MNIKSIALLALVFFQLPAYASELVETDWLAQNMSDKNIVIVDMTSDDLQYQRYHLPGAIRISYASLNTKLRNGVSVKITDQQLAMLLGLHGINANNHIVIYDDMAGLEAARLYWQLDSIGHEKKSLLNGGLVKWVLEGRKVEAGNVERDKTAYLLNNQKQRQNNATIGDVTSSSRVILLDVRSEEEYVGNPRYPRSGHIPGALFFPWDGNIRIDNKFTFKSAAAIQAQLDQLGVKDKSAPIIIYCQSGHRAAHAYFVLRYLGYTNVRVYDGSMAEYGQYQQLPLQKGNKP